MAYVLGPAKSKDETKFVIHIMKPYDINYYEMA